MTVLFHMPEDVQLSQASFGIRYGGKVEERRGGREDVFLNKPDRWASEFVVNPRHDDMAPWRRILRRLLGPAGFIYIHDITSAKPSGGARTAKAFEAYRNAGATFRWFDASDREFTWEDAGGNAFAWSGLPAVPSSTRLEVVEDAKSATNSVKIGGLWPNLLSVIKAGDYIQIGHWLYLADEDANSDINGQATVQIYPSLWRDVGVGTTIALECAATIMRLDTENVDWTRQAGERRRPFTVRFVEVLPSEGVPA